MKKAKYLDLVAEMAKNGDTQRTLSKLLGIAAPNVGKRISGETAWRIGEIEKICEYYKKDYYELFKTK
jgi:predicted transcriptional regulator